MKKYILLILMLCLIVPTIAAQPPFPETFQGSEGLSLESPPPRFSPINAAAQTIVHVFNISNGVKMGNDTGVYCEGDLLSLNGSILYEEDATAEGDHFIIGYPANLTSQTGIYGYTIYCQQNVSGTNILGGFFSGYIDVTETGKEIIDEGEKAVSIIVAIALLSALILVLYFKMNKDHWVLKTILMIFIPLLFILCGGFAKLVSDGTSYQSIGLIAYKVIIWFVRLFYTYIILYLAHEVIKYFRKTKGIKRK